MFYTIIQKQPTFSAVRPKTQTMSNQQFLQCQTELNRILRMESAQFEGYKKQNYRPNVLRPLGQKDICSDPMKPTFLQYTLKAVHVYWYYHRWRSKSCGLLHTLTGKRSVSEEHSASITTCRSKWCWYHCRLNRSRVTSQGYTFSFFYKGS